MAEYVRKQLELNNTYIFPYTDAAAVVYDIPAGSTFQGLSGSTNVKSILDSLQDTFLPKGTTKLKDILSLGSPNTVLKVTEDGTSVEWVSPDSFGPSETKDDDTTSIMVNNIKIADTSANGLIFTGGTNSFNISNGTVDVDVQITPSIGAVSKSASGLCPQLPNESTTTKFLRQDGTWQVPSYIANTDNTAFKLVSSISGNKKTDSTIIKAASSSALQIKGDTNKFIIGDGTNYIEVPITPSISNNVISNGTTTSGYLAKFSAANTITNGPQLSSTAIQTVSTTTKFLAEDGSWQVPKYTTSAGVVTNTTNGLVKAPNNNDSNVSSTKATSAYYIYGIASKNGTPTWYKLPDNAFANDTYSVFTKSGSGAASGLVPAPPTTAGTAKYLREDGTWATPPDNNTTYNFAKLQYKTSSTATAADFYLPGTTGTATNKTLVAGSNVSLALSGNELTLSATVPTKSSWNYDDRYIMVGLNAGTNGVDLDKLDTPGTYTFRSDSYWPSKGSPITSGAFKLIVMQTGYAGDKDSTSGITRYRTQIAITTNTIYIRHSGSQYTWSSWKQLATTSDGYASEQDVTNSFIYNYSILGTLLAGEPIDPTSEDAWTGFDALTTTNKDNLVAAINEVKGGVTDLAKTVTANQTIKINKISAPTASGGTTYGNGTSGQVLKSNGSTVYWASDSNSHRAIQVGGTQILANNTTTTALNLVAGSNITLTPEKNSSGAYTGKVTIASSASISSVESANKLTTPRSIWGQSFDGSSDIDGHLYLNNATYIYGKDTGGTNHSIAYVGSDNKLRFGYGFNGLSTHIYGGSISMYYGSDRTEGFTMSSDGKVGIGATTPSYTLDVNGKAAFGNADECSLYLRRPGVNYIIADDAEGSIVFRTGGNSSSTNRLIIDKEGNVGIGTTSPYSSLTVVKGIDVYNSSGDYGGAIGFGRKSAVGGVYNSSIHGWQIHNYKGNLQFYLEKANANATTGIKVHISSSGDVGIGTDAPSQKLHVDGKIVGDGIECRRVSYTSLSSAGWYKIGRCVYNSTSGNSAIIYINRTYNNVNNESYTVSINDIYNSKCSITQISGIANSQYITKVAVIGHNSDSGGDVYIYYKGGSTNSVSISGVGQIVLQAPTAETVSPSADQQLALSSSGCIVSGNIVAVGTVTGSSVYTNSDTRLKDNITPISDSIREFTWKKDGSKSYGFIAQELEQTNPELVNTKSDGYKTVNYDAAICLTIARLENRIKELERMLKDK